MITPDGLKREGARRRLHTLLGAGGADSASGFEWCSAALGGYGETGEREAALRFVPGSCDRNDPASVVLFEHEKAASKASRVTGSGGVVASGFGTQSSAVATVLTAIGPDRLCQPDFIAWLSSECH
ncbi:hypothetical protein [Sphingobium sp. SCG-1]|uniref:hypothetical protein n=1 Tax=Sphingobium sp. SCG-1 TaxID=2072936 RepID=UPI0011AB2E64|nr:hypothetical protein [Sphingobium sp. SCG-1]